MVGKASAIGEFLHMLNKITGNYQARVRASLIDTGGALVRVAHKPILKKLREKKRLTKHEKRIHHYCRQWKANRKKLK